MGSAVDELARDAAAIDKVEAPLEEQVLDRRIHPHAVPEGSAHHRVIARVPGQLKHVVGEDLAGDAAAGGVEVLRA